MKKFTTTEVIDLFNQVMREEIGFSEMVEVINEMVSEAEDAPEEPKEGDLAIFWQFDKTQAVVRLFDNKQGGVFQIPIYVDNTDHWWNNAIKFESKEQFEKLIKGEI